MDTNNKGTLVLNHRDIEHKIQRIALQINEHAYGMDNLILVGISGSGFEVAQRIFEALKILNPKIDALHVLNMDKKDVWNESKYYCDLDGVDLKNTSLVVIDDVLNSGGTLMKAVQHFMQHEIRQIITAVLIDRRHRRYPVRADIVGLTLSTTLEEHISVSFDNNEAKAVIV